MRPELVSIVMPAYNCGAYIGETIDSVLKQSYPYWELIVVDDCSSDNTKEIVFDYMKNDSRIHYHCLAKRSGVVEARTKATNEARGKYIAFLDSDDVWYPEKLKKQIGFMQDNNFAFSCTSYEKIDEEGKPLGKIIRSVPKADYNRVLLDNPIGNSTVIYNAEKLGKCYGPNIKRRNDYALWLRILHREPYVYGLPDVLMQYRVRVGSISSKKVPLIRYHWILYRDIEKLNIFRSIFHICFWCVIKILRLK
jgi:teichuronic acid biosynthesis glycosyltransferase TuaG